ncbi:hypothetical protein H7K24_14180 [Mycobacterium fragae]|uniref:hypothetical protein n=1 Tax=Mycobacterium fragae TaxID=1260918 RepID=UPI00111C3344|nr:hypothetical protein [Mycobacterium fragae]MCV7401301.1 hypothetical protein [Mycobacterium fragae]
MITFKMLTAGVLLAGPGVLAGVPVAQADPTPAEVQYLNDVRHAIQVSQDTPDQAKSDAELLSEGHMACHDRDLGAVGVGKTGIGPVIATWAFADLCPNG